MHPQGLPTLILGYRLYELEGDGTSTVLVPGGGNFVVQGGNVQVIRGIGLIGGGEDALGRAADADVDRAFSAARNNESA